MPDFSVYVTLINNTGETFTDGYADAIRGQWCFFPSIVHANEEVSFRINDTSLFYGTEGTFRYNIGDTDRDHPAEIKTYQRDPMIADYNEVSYTSPSPAALYTCSFRARVADEDWTDNSVAPRGHPVYVEYTVGYQREKSFKFELIDIIATSDHPVRNSRKELISGRHILWDRENPSTYADGTRGSFQPNVFAYEFNSQVASSGTLEVTVKPLDIELIGAEVILCGTRDGKRVIQSDYFYFKSLQPVTVRARVIDPAKSPEPLSLNADVDWGMELRFSGEKLQRIGPGITRLELYWIATTLHRAFEAPAYTPVTFLRHLLPKIAKATVDTKIIATYFEIYQDITWRVFDDCVVASQKSFGYIKAINLAGVTPTGLIGSIDGQVIQSQRRLGTMTPLTEPLSQLANAAVAHTMPPVAYVDWPHLPTWLKSTLGDAWNILHEHVTVNEAEAQAFWLISDANSRDSSIRVHITVVSVTAESDAQSLDMKKSAAIVGEHVNRILTSTERSDVWTLGSLPGLEGNCLQYSDHIEAGRIVLVAGNVVMDIAGMASTEELLPYALKLLNRTVRRDRRLPIIFPVLQRQAIRMETNTTTLAEANTETSIITVTGIDTRFSLVFSVSCKIAAADARSEECGVLFDRHIVEEVDNGEGCNVEFLFIARRVGRHRVRVCVADMETMIGTTFSFEVEVVDA